VLTQTLHRLEEFGLVNQVVYPDIHRRRAMDQHPAEYALEPPAVAGYRRRVESERRRIGTQFTGWTPSSGRELNATRK
jgi:hypothetical protein